MRIALPVAFVLVATASIHGQTTTCISAPPWLEIHGDGDADWASISADGRFVTFISASESLVPGDTNDEEDVFLYDRLTDQYERITSEQDVVGVRGSAVSDDGRYVAYHASVWGPIPGSAFVRDRVLGVDTPMFIRTDGTLAPELYYIVGRIAMSGDGRCVAFDSTANMMGDEGDLVRQIYLHDRDADGNGVFDEPGGIRTIRASASSAGIPANAVCDFPAISHSGRFVTFVSQANNLGSGDTNGQQDVFVHDRDVDADGIFDEAGQILTERVSVASDGTQAEGFLSTWPSISDDGRYVVFQSRAANLVPNDSNAKSDVFLRDRLLNETSRVSTAIDGSQSGGFAGSADITPDGRFVTYFSQAMDVFAGDTDDLYFDVVVWDRLSRSKKRASFTSQQVPSIGVGAPSTLRRHPRISQDARFVLLGGYGTDLVSPPPFLRSVFLRDRGPRYLADIDGAGAVNVIDLLAVINSWGPCPAAPVPCPADLDGNGSVSVGDLLLIINNWG